jgi:hypothetical protein
MLGAMARVASMAAWDQTSPGAASSKKVTSKLGHKVCRFPD